jgi:hypothetical protein
LGNKAQTFSFQKQLKGIKFSDSEDQERVMQLALDVLEYEDLSRQLNDGVRPWRHPVFEDKETVCFLFIIGLFSYSDLARLQIDWPNDDAGNNFKKLVARFLDSFALFKTAMKAAESRRNRKVLAEVSIYGNLIA